jgi:hypothetical protein
MLVTILYSCLVLLFQTSTTPKYEDGHFIPKTPEPSVTMCSLNASNYPEDLNRRYPEVHRFLTVKNASISTVEG